MRASPFALLFFLVGSAAAQTTAVTPSTHDSETTPAETADKRAATQADPDAVTPSVAPKIGDKDADEPPLPAGIEAATQADDDDEPPLPAGIEAATQADDDDEPALPAGIEASDDDEPALPAGIEASDDDEPALPAGLDASPETEHKEESDEPLPVDLHGFLDARGGSRLDDVDNATRGSLGEARLQLSVTGDWEWFAAKIVGDAVYDPVLDEHEPDLETGEGAFELRQANFIISPVDFMDLQIGRQVVTWGTGDLVFINDLFPKDWTSFMIGRDMEYLKAPSDAARLLLYTDWVNVDVVFTPHFDGDRIPDRRRLISYEPSLGQPAGNNALPSLDRPDVWFEDYEVAGRITRRWGAYELALYGYTGFWKTPAGFNPMTGEGTYPELSVYGGSLRGPLLGGIANLEGGYYDSREDRDGDDPTVYNSEVRWLAAFEREVVQNLTMSGQYYAEWMQKYEEYSKTRPEGMVKADEIRHVLTTRLTWRTLQQRMDWSLFAFYSPSDQDMHLRPAVKYRIDDFWRVEAGANIFFGEENHTFYAQFEDNTNVWTAVRMTW